MLGKLDEDSNITYLNGHSLLGAYTIGIDYDDFENTGYLQPGDYLLIIDLAP